MTTLKDVREFLNGLAGENTSAEEDRVLLQSFARTHPDLEPPAKELLEKELAMLESLLQDVHSL